MENNRVRGIGAYSHVLLSATFGIVAIAEAIRLGILHADESFITGPGGYMMVVGISLIIFALIGTFTVSFDRRRSATAIVSSVKPDQSPADRARLRKVVLSFLFCVLYVLLIQFLGFAIASLLYLAANLWLLQNPVRRIVFTCFVMFPILIFGLPLIGLSVPKGIFGI